MSKTSLGSRSLWSSPAQIKELFGFDEKTGFIRIEPPRVDKTNLAWHQLASNINIILKIYEPKIARERIEAVIEGLEDFVLPSRFTIDETAFALRDLAFIQNAILHCDPDRKSSDNLIPQKLAIPLIELSKRLGIPPVMSYPLYISYNAKKAAGGGGVVGIEEDAANTFTVGFPKEDLTRALHESTPGHNDEAHFIRIHQGVERKAIPLLQAMFDLLAIYRDEFSEKRGFILDKIIDMTKALKAMREDLVLMYFGTGTKAFNEGIRKFLKGTEGFGSEGERGVFTIDKTGNKILVSNHPGGSGAQTPLFLIIDEFLGIKKTAEAEKFARNQQPFILLGARYLIHSVKEDSVEIKNFIRNDLELNQAFSDLATELYNHRNAHMIMAKRYIGNQQGTGGSLPDTLQDLRDGTAAVVKDRPKASVNAGEIIEKLARVMSRL